MAQQDPNKNTNLEQQFEDSSDVGSEQRSEDFAAQAKYASGTRELVLQTHGDVLGAYDQIGEGTAYPPDHLFLINLNPIFKEEKLNNDFLMSKKEYFYEDMLATAETTSFDRFYSKKTEHIKKLFRFFQRRLDDDLSSKKRNIKTNGIDFEKHMSMIESVPNEIKRAALKANPLLGDLMRESENKYQTSIVMTAPVGTYSTFMGVYLFFPNADLRELLSDVGLDEGADKISSISADYVRFFIPGSFFQNDSPFKSLFFQFNGYMQKLDLLADLGREDLTRAENHMNCGFTPGAADYPPLLDYFSFSHSFHQPTPITVEENPVENSKWRENAAQAVDAFTGAMDDATKSLTRSLSQFISDPYTVVDGDKMTLTTKNYTAGSVFGAKLSYDGDKKSPLMELSRGWLDQAELSAAADRTSLITFQSRSGPEVNADAVIEINREDEALKKKLVANFKKTGNALEEGMVIQIPKQSGTKNKWKNLLNSVEMEEMDPERLKEIWNEAFLDPFLARICPATLPKRVLECLLPGNCRDLMKYIGLWRTRDFLEEFIAFDLFSDTKSLVTALTKWDELVQEQYSFKAVQFNGNGFLKSGTTDSKEVFPNGADSVSVSLQVKVKPENKKTNDKKVKSIFSQKGVFEIKKGILGDIKVVLYSQDGKKVTYTNFGESTIDFDDDYWHQLGFSWAGNTGNFTLYFDGREVKTKKDSGDTFTGPLASPDSTRFLVASESHEESRKGFAGQLDEICVFDKTLSAAQWKSLGKIDSDVNLNTARLKLNVKAWWRMGDAVDDRTPASGVTGKIVDLAGGKDLSFGNPSEGSTKIIVAHLFKEKDENRFIDIINRETDVEKVCDTIMEYIMELVEVSFDPEKIKKDILDQINIPNFSGDPHKQVKLIIKKTIVEQLLKMVATFLMKMIAELLNCDSWRGMVKALVKGTVNFDANTFGSAFVENNPVAEFINATQDPEEWSKILKDTESYFLKGVSTSLSTGFQMHESGSNGQHKYTTLGIGQVQFAEEHNIGAQVFDTINGTTVSIENSEGTNSQDVVVNLVKKASRDTPPESVLALLASGADPTAVANMTEILNSSSDETGITFSNDDTEMFFGTIGSQLGFQNVIDQLRYAAQVVDQAVADPEFCIPSQTTSQSLGLQKTPAQTASDKATVQDILKRAEQLNSSDTGNGCSTPVPLSGPEEESLKRTINDVFSPITSAYDSDLLLYKLGLTSIDTKTRKIPKVLWKGDKPKVKVADENGNIKIEEYEIKETQINPEFEGMLEQGFIPTLKNGKPCGTRAGGVVKTQWNPFTATDENPWLKERRPPESLMPKPPENEDDEVQQPDLEIGDLIKSLGPYTDYPKGYEDANVPYNKVTLGGNAGNALSANVKGFILDPNRGLNEARYFENRTKASRRGIENIRTKSRTTLIPPSNANNPPPANDSYSTVTHEVSWGRSLSGVKLVSLRKTGAENLVLDPVEVPFNLSSETLEAINSMGYDAGPAECEDVLATGGAAGGDKSAGGNHTPQENVFADVLASNKNTARISNSKIKTDVYDSLYKEVLTAAMFYIADSPLLKTIPDIVDSDGSPMLAINFLNLNTTPRLIDMPSLASQVSEDYTNLMACPDELVEPPLYTALKTAAPRILARMYITDIMLRAIVPFSQLFFSSKDPLIHGLIINRIEADLNLFANKFVAGKAAGVKAKIVEQYNSLAKTGQIDAPMASEEPGSNAGFKTAMGYFIEDEFDFVVDRLKETVHGDCIPKSGDDKASVTQEMYNIIMKYADLGDRNLKVETYAITKETETEEPKVLKDFSIPEQLDEIDVIGTSLSYFYNDLEVLLSKVEHSAEDLIKELGINLDDIECDNNSIYDPKGFTTPTEDHYHSYDTFAGSDGNGNTTKTFDLDGNEIFDERHHNHSIYQFAVVPKFNSADQVEHVHSLVTTKSRKQSEAAKVMDQVQSAMREKLTQTDSFKVLFDFCFDLNDAGSLAMMYCLQSSDDQIMSRVFNSTKKSIITMFGWLWEQDQSSDSCSSAEAESMSLDFEDMFPDLAAAALNPELLLMLLVAPLTTYKGWAKTADPHVFITSTIIDLIGMPILPKNSKEWVTLPFSDTPECRNWPDFSQAVSPLDTLFAGGENLFNPAGPPFDLPPLYLPAPLIEGLVALGVTWAPCLVGMPPFPPTPFGMIYYFAVSPLIWLMRDLPRLIEMMQGSEAGRKSLAAAGLAVEGEISCEDQTPQETVDSGTAEVVEEGCPPLKTFEETVIDAGTQKDC
tara:strand:+ start:20627 stop:27373 length:6747 start_codon:yes stop_codon:yes gene_type:complete